MTLRYDPGNAWKLALHDKLVCMCVLQSLSMEEQLSGELCTYPENLGPRIQTTTQHTIVGEPVKSGTEHNTQIYRVPMCTEKD